MITNGAHKILGILVIHNGPKICPPCGAYRQRIYEIQPEAFGKNNLD